MTIMADLLPSLFTASFFLLLFFIFILNRQFLKPTTLPLPPSPPSLPLVGHLHLIKTHLPFQRTLQTLSTTYGHVFTLKLGFRHAVVVSSPAGVEDCLVKNDLVLADRPSTRAAKHLNYDCTTLSNCSYGDHFRALRKILNLQIFSAPMQTGFIADRQDEVKKLLKSIFVSTGVDQRVVVELRSRFSEMTLNGILRMISGERWREGRQGDELRERIRERMGLSVALANPADCFPFLLRLYDYKDYEKRLVRLKDQMDDVLQSMVDLHRKQPDKDHSNNALIDNLLSMQEADPALLTDVTIKGLILVLINAGSDTSSITMEWAMSLLLNNPSKLKKARDQIDSVVGWDRLVQESDLPNLPYIQCIINETLRLYPSTPLLLPHQASSDCIIQGYRIKRGTMVLINAYALQRDASVWEDPMRFMPERFENVQDQMSYAYKWIPFGVGRRICPGASMANKVLGLALASLIQCFDWEKADEPLDMSESPGLTMSRVKPLEAMCRPREEMIHVLSSSTG